MNSNKSSIENVETDKVGCYVDTALLGRNLNRWKFPLVMVNESEQPYKLVDNVLIGRLETGGRFGQQIRKSDEISEPRKEKVKKLIEEFEVIFL